MLILPVYDQESHQIVGAASIDTTRSHIFMCVDYDGQNVTIILQVLNEGTSRTIVPAIISDAFLEHIGREATSVADKIEVATDLITDLSALVGQDRKNTELAETQPECVALVKTWFPGDCGWFHGPPVEEVTRSNVDMSLFLGAYERFYAAAGVGASRQVALQKLEALQDSPEEIYERLRVSAATIGAPLHAAKYRFMEIVQIEVGGVLLPIFAQMEKGECFVHYSDLHAEIYLRTMMQIPEVIHYDRSPRPLLNLTDGDRVQLVRGKTNVFYLE